MRKIGLFLLFMSLIAVSSACSSDAVSTVKVGISGSDTTVWDLLLKRLKKKE